MHTVTVCWKLSDKRLLNRKWHFFYTNPIVAEFEASTFVSTKLLWISINNLAWIQTSLQVVKGLTPSNVFLMLYDSSSLKLRGTDTMSTHLLLRQEDRREKSSEGLSMSATSQSRRANSSRKSAVERGRSSRPAATSACTTTDVKRTSEPVIIWESSGKQTAHPPDRPASLPGQRRSAGGRRSWPPRVLGCLGVLPKFQLGDWVVRVFVFDELIPLPSQRCKLRIAGG